MNHRSRSLRLAYRTELISVLDETGAPMKVQQELMWHASIQTTMNVYGQALSSGKREANSKVVRMVLKPVLAAATKTEPLSRLRDRGSFLLMGVFGGFSIRPQNPQAHDSVGCGGWI
jgi:hypothetical protein